MVDVVDEAVLVAVGHRAGGRRLDLAAGGLVLVVLDDRDVGVDAVEVGVAAARGGAATRSSTRLIVRPLLRKAICWKRARIVS